MTSETSQIQTLIHQIDEVLNKTSPRLPWVMSSDAAQQRQVLEQTRRYLLSLQNEKITAPGDGMDAGRAGGDEEAATESRRATAHPQEVVHRQETASAEASAQQVLQSVLQEMTYLRTNMLQPMRSDVEVLQHQRDALLQEVRRLEMQRQQYVMAQQPPEYLQEFLQAAMKQMQDNLSSQVAQLIAASTAQSSQLQGGGSVGAEDLTTLSPAERLERLRAIQSQSDQLLLRLDTTLRVVFESLQRNLQSYQDSLGEGLGRMHDMGQQGEAVFAAFVTRLAQILGREASSFLQAPQSGWGEEQRFAYGDAARTLPGQDAEADRPRIENDPDQQITRLLEELNALDQSGFNQTATGEPVPFDIDDPTSSLSPEAERERLEALDRELSQLDLSALEDTPTDIEISPMEEDPFFPFPPFSDEAESSNVAPANQQPIEAVSLKTSDLDDDLDSALDLLSQISAAVSEETTETRIDLEADSKWNTQSSAKSDSPTTETERVSTPDDLYRDEFYQDLFGSLEEDEAEPSDASSPGNDRESGMAGDRLPEEAVSELEVGEWEGNHDLFAGLADPSQAESAQPEARDASNVEPSPDFPQSVENLLVQPSEPRPLAEELTLDTFLLEEALPNPLEGVEPEPPEESVDSLADLIPDIEPDSGRADRTFANPADEAYYETAHPGEDLLITESAAPDPVDKLRLPPDTLQQLTHDLFNLEGSPLSAEATESGWTLADWTEAVDSPAAEAKEQDTTQPFKVSDWTDGNLDVKPPSRLSDQAIEALLFTDSFANRPSGDSSIEAVPNQTDQRKEAAIDPLEVSDSSVGDDDLLETTLEDWFANVEAEPVVTPEADWQEGSTVEDSETNSFTLDGLDSLFEGVPAPPSPRQPSETDTQRITIDDAFGEAFEDRTAPSGSSPSEGSAQSSAPVAPDWAVEKKKHDGTVADLVRNLLGVDATNAPVHPSPRPAPEPARDESNRQTPLTRDRVHLFSPPPKPVPDEQTQGWFVGIDLGTTGLSVVLVNPSTEQFYPLYWTIASAPRSSDPEGKAPIRRFRLPTVVAFSTDSADPDHQPGHQNDRIQESATPSQRFSLPIPIASGTVKTASERHGRSSAPPPPETVWVQPIKPYLRLGIPYYSPQTQQWEPVLQWSDHQRLPLAWLQAAFQTLLLTLKQPTRTTMGTLRCSALGLSDQSLQNALHQLAGVVMGYPANWSDTYSFNLREGILQAGLVAQPEQIFFLEDTIATLLSVLQRQHPRDSGQAEPASAPSSPAPDQGVVLQNADWQGLTLVLNAGATMTELTLVNLPEQLNALTHKDFQHRSLPFAGNAIDQDIVCQWLYPLLQQPPSNRTRHLDRIDLALGTVDLASVDLDTLTLPIVGEPDLSHRYRLHQRLEASPSGQILLEAARHLKIAFQQQSYFTLQLGDRIMTLLRQDLGSRVLLPYVQRLNRELNTLLKQVGVTAPEIRQVICTGGTASMGAIARWLRQKLPNAVIIQDTYTRPNVPQDNCIFSCSRVAYGLAVLPLCANLLNVTRHQCNDYFLLLELLRHFPQAPASARQIVETLKQEGVNAELCQSHLLALLEGRLPPGLIPTERESTWFTPDSLQNPILQAIQSAPLFEKRGTQYHPNFQQQQQLQQFLDGILAQSRQTLTHPYTKLPNALISDS